LTNMIRCFAIGIIFICSHINGQLSFQMIYGTSNNDNLVSTVKLDGSSSLLFFNSSYYNTSTINVIKISNLGDVQWRKKSEGDFDKVYHAIRTKDSCVVIVGSVEKYNQYFRDYRNTILAKIDSSGSILWCRQFDYGHTAIPSKVIELENGNLVIVGSGQKQPNQPYDIYTIQTDSNGQELWSYAYGGNGGDYGNSIIQCHNNTLLIAGYTYDFAGTYTKVYLVNTDLTGNIIWTKVLDNSNWDIASDIAKDQSNNYYITGSSIILPKIRATG
jgi:hypothetical protein